MRLPDFKLERFFARWEFNVQHTLGSSDLEGWRLADLLALADDEGRALWRDLTLGYTESAGHPALRADRPADAFCADLIEREGVLLLPGSVFDHLGNHVRLGFGRTDLPAALARLERFMAAR